MGTEFQKGIADEIQVQVCVGCGVGILELVFMALKLWFVGNPAVGFLSISSCMTVHHAVLVWHSPGLSF